MRKPSMLLRLVSNVLLIGLLAGCAGKPSGTPTPQTGSKQIEQVSIGLAGSLRTFDPTAVVDSVSRGVFIHIFDPLMHRKADGTIEFRVAEKYDQVSDTVVRIAIRKGVKFSNGAELTADDVKFTLDRYRDKAISEAAGTLTNVKDVRVKDQYTVEIETTVPDPILKTLLVDFAFVVPKAVLEKDPTGFARNPVGSGPYTLKEWVQGDRVTAQRRDDHWGAKLAVKQVTWRFIPEASTRVAALLAGQVDIIDEVPSQQVAAINGNSATTVKSQPALNITYVNMRWDDPILKNQKVRQALNFAVNKQALLQGVLSGQGKIQTQQLPEGMLGSAPGLNPYPYNVEKAKQLLTEAGYANGFKMDLEYPVGSPTVAAKEAAEAVAGDLRKIGVDVNLISTEWGIFFKKLFVPDQPGLAHAFVFYLKMPNFDPAEYAGRLFLTGGLWNWSHYKDDKVNDLLMKASGTLEEKAREGLYTEANQLLTENPPFIYLFQPVHLVAVKKDLPFERPAANMIWLVDMLGQ